MKLFSIKTFQRLFLCIKAELKTSLSDSGNFFKTDSGLPLPLRYIYNCVSVCVLYNWEIWNMQNWQQFIDIANTTTTTIIIVIISLQQKFKEWFRCYSSSSSRNFKIEVETQQISVYQKRKYIKSIFWKKNGNNTVNWMCVCVWMVTIATKEEICKYFVWYIYRERRRAEKNNFVKLS